MRGLLREGMGLKKNLDGCTCQICEILARRICWRSLDRIDREFISRRGAEARRVFRQD